MHAVQPLRPCPSAQTCARCGIPLDAQHFDASSVVDVPPVGRDVVLARFSLPPEYCGVLELFAQFTDEHAVHPERVATPGLRWALRVNQRPLHPYLELEHIVNPWGLGGFPVMLRLEDRAVLELAVRVVSPPSTELKKVGGRVSGRYWYDTAYGDAVGGHFE